MRDMHDQPAGWYRDPVRPNRHRHWSGERWGDCVGEELAVEADAVLRLHALRALEAG